jgi:hypothetical protein
VLHLLNEWCRIPYRHASFSTKEELKFQLHEWKKRSERFPYLYLASHGTEGEITCSKLNGRGAENDYVDLTWISSELGRPAKGSVIFFGGAGVPGRR